MSLINCGGCYQRHARPSCLFKQNRRPKEGEVTKGAIVSTTTMAAGFTDEESEKLFGSDWTDGVVPDRGSKEYVDYLEGVFKAQAAEHDKKLLEVRTRDVENRLRKLSLSPLPAPHGSMGGLSDPDAATELHGVSSLADKLSKLRPEYYCDPTKSHEKMTFRELIRGCAKVLSFLRVSNINVDGYLSHLSFLLDKSAMGVYTTEGLVLYERSVTTKVLDGVILDWPEVDPSSDSRYLSYEYTFDHMAKGDKHEKTSRHSKRKSPRKSSSILYDFELWDKNSADICWMWNCRSCEGCDRKHGLCGLCHESHRAVECEKYVSSKKSADQPSNN